MNLTQTVSSHCPYMSTLPNLILVGNKRQSLPVKPNLRSLATERPRSSDSVVHHEAFPVLDSFQQNRYPRETGDRVLEHGRENTPTPTQYASPRTTRYMSTSALSPHDQPSREWSRSPDTQHSGGRRLPSEAMSRQRLQRLGAHDALNETSLTPYEQEASMLGPKTPGEQRRSDPETESVGSNTAPSTVWDELDDLKSRIRNLEMTGKMPSTSAGAMANQQSGERPRTATTAPTTISSSPQRVRKNSVAAPDLTVGGPAAANIHPLLHSALAKARPLISPSLYRAVEATAADALALAAMTGSTGPQGPTNSAASVISGMNISDRQLRRKADSMCRNVTDLCIALCEGRSNFASPIVRHSPASMYRFQGETPPSRYARRESMDTDERMMRSSPSRSFSRMESRRGSLLGLGASNIASSPRDISEQYSTQDSSPSQAHVDYASRYNRPGTSLLRTRYTSYDDQPEDPSIRAPSRAMTEMSQPGQRRNDYITVMQPRSPGLREALAARRNSGIPEERMDEEMTSPETTQERYRGVLERHRAPISEASLLLSNKRRRRITSLEQYSASPRLNNEPMRTTSLSRRRNVVIE